MRLGNSRAVRETGRSPVVLAAILAMVAALAVVPAAGAAQPSQPDDGATADLWTDLAAEPAPARNGVPAQVRPERFRALTVDTSALGDALAEAPHEREGGADALVVSLPAPDGSFQRFALEESPVMEAGLAAKHPEIKTYAGKGIDDPAATIRADLTPLGFHASVRAPSGAWYVDPYYRHDDSVYVSYFGRDLEDTRGVFVERDPLGEAEVDALSDSLALEDVPQGPEVQLRTYRLALLSNPGYATYFGAANVTAAKVTLINRVTQIYEDETGIRLVIIANNDLLNLNTPELMTLPNGPCGLAACFTQAQSTGCSSGTLTRNRIVIGQIVGASAYDVGHIILGNPGGGVASLNSVGGNNKAQGCTGLSAPVGDFFAVDYVAHEVGHQFGGNHTFNGTQSNCSGGNRSAANSVEPGSGSSIMAYAGICAADNLQPNSDPYWSQRSYQEVTAFVTSDRPAINEVQNASLYGFDTDGDSFRLSFQGQVSAPIVRGVNYNVAGIQAAIAGIPGWPGGTVAVANFAGGGSPSDNGFQFTFGEAPLALTNVPEFQLVDFVGASGFVGETAKGGPVDNQGNTVTPTGNHAPVAEAPASYTIPRRTPFALTGAATDFDGDALTYLWEQNDRGAAAGTALQNNTKANGPLFRVFGTPLQRPPYVPTEFNAQGQNHPTDNPTRVFPDQVQIAANRTNAVTGTCPAGDVECFSEFLPTSDYVGFAGVNADPARLNFRLTVRDNKGGVGRADTVLFLASDAGPFLVTGPGAAVTAAKLTPVDVTWNVAGTDGAAVGATDVKISLSIDGGLTFPYVLAASTPNDGAATVVLPDVSSTDARVKVEAVGNVFFDISDEDFTITGGSVTASGTIPAENAEGAYLPTPGTALQVAIDAGVAAGGGEGDVTLRFRSAGLRYAIQGGAISSLQLDPGVAGPGHGALTAAATLLDVSASNNPVVVAEGLTLHLTFVDNGEPSRYDWLSVSLTDASGNVVFSTDWAPTTNEQARRTNWTRVID